MKLVGYLRVSTEAQLDGYGLEVQREAIERWAKANKHRVVKWCSDEGVSGTLDVTDRAGFGCVIDNLRDGTAQGFAVARLDRLARELFVQEAALGLVWKLGSKAFTVDGGEVLPDDPDDPARTLVRKVLGLVSEYERTMITKRLRDGRRAKKARGGYHSGAPPYGWRTENAQLVRDDREQEGIALMHRLRKQGTSLRDIALDLEDSGFVTKRGESSWSPSAISRALEADQRITARLG